MFQLPDLGTEKFLGRNRLSRLYLNASGITSLTNRTFLGLWGLKELHLEHNELTSLGEDVFAESGELRELYLHNNRLTSIANATFAGLAELRTLTLHGNRLVSLAQVDLGLLLGLERLTLGRNPWACSCQLSLAFHKLAEVSPRVGHVSCSDPASTAVGSAGDNTQNILSFHSSCKDLDVQAVSSKSASSPFLVLLLTGVVGLVMVVTVSVLLVIKRHSITAWVYAKGGSPKVEDHSQYSPMLKRPPAPLSSSPSAAVSTGGGSMRPGLPPSLVEYSAYLHYCLADDVYVKQVLAPKLESVDSRYKICLHHRDLPQSCTVGQAIGQAVANSRCLLILASPAYFLSSIPSYELQMILSEVLPRYTSYPVVVAVSKASIPDIRGRFRQLAGCQADTWTYLEAADILFYDRVANLVQAGGGSGAGGLLDLSSDASSCSTKSTGAASSSTLPPPLPRLASPRVINNPMDRFNQTVGGRAVGSLKPLPAHPPPPPPSDSIYSTVLDTASEDGEVWGGSGGGGGEDRDPTYQSVYADQTLYIDRNLTLVKALPPQSPAANKAAMSPRFKTLK